MPAALERKLKRQAAKDPGIKDKDAYVYGTLRKTGWKPSTQKKNTKKMNDPSKTIEFEGLGEELPAVGKSLERLRNIIKNPTRPGVRIDIARGRVGAIGPRTGMAKYWSSPGEIKANKVWPAGGRPPVNRPTAYLGRGGPARGPILYSDSSNLVRLAQIDNQLDSIVRFAYDNEDDRRGHPLLKTGAAAGVGAAGLYGYGLTRRGVNPGQYGGGLYKAAGTDIRNIGSAIGAGRLPTAAVGDIGKSIAAGGRGVAAKAKLGWGKLAGLFGKLRGLSSKEALVRFDEHILEPASAEAVPNTKIIQEHFPAGLSPAAALRMPFPELMKLLKERNILQQQFSKIEKLIEIDSKVDQLVQFENLTGKANWKGQSPETNLRRGLGMGFLAGGPYGAAAGGIAASAYGKRGVLYKKRDPWGHAAEGIATSVAGGIGGALLGGKLGGARGAAIGQGVGAIGGFTGGFGLGARHTLRKRKEELKHGQIFSAKMQRLIQLNSNLDDSIEFEFTEKAKKKFEEAKEKIKAKFQKKKGHKSHGGGT